MVSSIARRWEKWLNRLESFIVPSNIKDKKQQKAMLLHFAGEQVFDIYEALGGTAEDDFEKTKKLLTDHFKPKKNIVFEQHVFRQAVQQQGETTSEYFVRLKKLASTCEFANEDQALLAQMIEGITSTKLRRQALRDPSITLEKLLGKRTWVRVNIVPVSTQALIDTGSSVNLVDAETFQKIQLKSDLELTTTSTQYFAYGSHANLPIIGKFKTEIHVGDKRQPAEVAVVNKVAENIIGYETADVLGIIKITLNINAEQTLDPQEEFPQLFQGMGKLKDLQVHLHVDPSVTPVAQHRRIPLHIRKAVEEKLKELEDGDIIEKVSGPTPWMSPLVIVPKPGKEEIRLCLDMREPNKAIKRERHVMPTIDDIICTVSGAKMFSKLDLRDGHHQLELAEDSRHITTFSAHCGIYRYKRLNFGISSAAEVFQEVIRQVINGVEGVINASDDIIVSGKTIEEHNQRLHLVLQRLSKAGLVLNAKKCVFRRTSLKFFGLLFTSEGIKPDPEKVKSICRLSQPNDVREIRSFLGMVTYCARFLPRLAQVVEPLRQLTKKGVEFAWTARHSDAFNEAKKLMSEERKLAYFDPSHKTELTVDAGPKGVGAILSQVTRKNKSRVIAYHSRPLSPVEQRYSQIERELLAILSAITHFHLYLYGPPFSVQTDHKPLVSILQNSRCMVSARMERMLLKLQQYTFQVRHIVGSSNPADFLSRNVVEDNELKETAVEEYVNHIAQQACPKALTLELIEEATKNDAILSKLSEVLQTKPCSNSSWTQEISPFKAIANELSVTAKGAILRGNRLVIPESLQKKVIQLAHRGHMGIRKTKQLLREKVWFKGIDRAVENAVKTCIPCQAVVQENIRTPIIMTKLPEGPWQNLALDFAGPFPDGQYLLVLVDEYSRFPVIRTLKSLDTDRVTKALRDIFTLFGMPVKVKIDNGPPFSGYKFKYFMADLGIHHHLITPLWPEANGEVERLMRTINKTARAANTDGRDWKIELEHFLLNYRATTHSTTGKSPGELHFGRRMRTCIPEVRTPVCDAEVRRKDEEMKQKCKTDAEKRKTIRPLELQEGDKVLVKEKKKNKLSPAYNPNP
ncbi:uncharacterized protein K02A2.6-like [Ornithodoros turicata]|uniref:uncharacterized protein K02A2.6-like n=1 Tax=Ornithodoros turicata TaxID=34597 RepID=UPI003138FAC0